MPSRVGSLLPVLLAGLLIAACARAADPPPSTVTEIRSLLESQSYRQALQKAQADRALTEATQALGVHPREAALHVLRAQAHEALWQPEEAAASYQEARRLGRSDFETERSLGDLRLGLGAWDLAKAAFLRALSLKPADASTLIGLGLANYWSGDWARASELFQRAGTEEPSNELAIHLADALQALREGGAAERVYWFEREGLRLFCVPIGWRWEELPGSTGNVREVLFSPGKPAKDGGRHAALSYVRYDYASRRVGKLRELDRVEPREVLDGYFRQAYEQIADPQKVWQRLSPIFRRGRDRYARVGFAHTVGSLRQADRILAYYQPDEDVLHILTFTASPDEQGWTAFLDACFLTAPFGRAKVRG